MKGPYKEGPSKTNSAESKKEFWYLSLKARPGVYGFCLRYIQKDPFMRAQTFQKLQKSTQVL